MVFHVGSECDFSCRAVRLFMSRPFLEDSFANCSATLNVALCDSLCRAVRLFMSRCATFYVALVFLFWHVGQNIEASRAWHLWASWRVAPSIYGKPCAPRCGDTEERSSECLLSCCAAHARRRGFIHYYVVCVEMCLFACSCE